jgi:cold-inducible RNA-binding protein
MAKKLFVGGLPFSMGDAELRELFAPIGEVVSATVLMDRETGRSRGFGFVEMTNDAEAEEAIAKLNNTKVGDRSIVVNEAREREERGPRTYGTNDRRFDNRGGGNNYRSGGGGGHRR